MIQIWCFTYPVYVLGSIYHVVYLLLYVSVPLSVISHVVSWEILLQDSVFIKMSTKAYCFVLSGATWMHFLSLKPPRFQHYHPIYRNQKHIPCSIHACHISRSFAHINKRNRLHGGAFTILHIAEFPGLNLCMETDYSDRGFWWFFSVLQVYAGILFSNRLRPLISTIL
jgi:hypothetical protein